MCDKRRRDLEQLNWSILGKLPLHWGFIRAFWDARRPGDSLEEHKYNMRECSQDVEGDQFFFSLSWTKLASSSRVGAIDGTDTINMSMSSFHLSRLISLWVPVLHDVNVKLEFVWSLVTDHWSGTCKRVTCSESVLLTHEYADESRVSTHNKCRLLKLSQYH